MPVGRRKPPVLAEISAGRLDGPATLRRSDLEAYRGLLSRLGGGGVILMTGTRTVRRRVAIGIAATAVSAGVRTALVECDLVQPGLADALGLKRLPGLHEHLRGEVEPADALRPVVLAGPGSAQATDPLVCLVAGSSSAEGPRLFASKAFAKAISGLRAAYRLVVLDGPPLRDEHSVRAVMPCADSTVACLGAEERRGLPISASGLVIAG